MAIYHEQPVFHRRRFFHGKAIQGAEAPDIAWLDPSGKEMSDQAWNESFVRCLGVQLFGKNIDIDEHGEQIDGDTMLLLFNADHANTITFVLPQSDNGQPWELLIDTAKESTEDPRPVEGSFDLTPCSMAVLRVKTSEKAKVS